MKDLNTEIHYLLADANALEKAINKKDLVFARRLIQAIRETTDNLAVYTEQIAQEDN